MMSFEDMEASLKGGGPAAVSAPQLFPTPSELAARMVEGIREGDRVLEPSAGTGALLRPLPQGVHSTAVEVNGSLCRGLNAVAHRVVHSDFLDCTVGDLGWFDFVLANPPFTKDQDIRHIRHMWQFVKVGGRLITLSGTGWTFGERKSCREFRDWLEEIDADREEIPRGTFAGTDVGTVLITATKEAVNDE